MTDPGRRGVSMGVIVAVLVVGGLAWFVFRGPGAGETSGAPANRTAMTSPTPEQPQPPTISVPDAPPPQPLVPPVQPGGEGVGVAAGAGRPAVAEDPVVAHGRVVWPGGGLPEEVDVTLYDKDGVDLEYTSTDAKGEFALRHGETLADGWSVGTDEVTLVEGAARQSLTPAVAGDLPEHRPGEPPVELELVIGFAPVLAGRVIDKVTGRPLPMADVGVSSLLPAHELDDIEAITGDDGRYELPVEGLPLQRVIAWCRCDGYQAVLVGPMDLVAAGHHGDVTEMNFELEAEASLRGRVVDAATGFPVVDATVNLGSRYPTFADASDWEITNEDGSFEISVPEIPADGAWLLVTDEGEYAPAAVFCDGTWNIPEIRLGRPVTLAGRVTNASGAAVPGAGVRVGFDGDTRELDQGLYDETFADDEGAFELALEVVPVGSGLLHVSSGSYLDFDAPLAGIAHALAGDRYEVSVVLSRP